MDFSLSVVIPAYNDQDSLPVLVRDIEEVIKQNRRVTEHEIIIVNDGSQDGTQSTIEDLVRTYPSVRFVQHPHNRGYGAALITGFNAVRKDYTFYTDGDGQFNCADLSLFLAKVESNAVIIGYREKKRSGVYRTLLSFGYNLITSYVLRLPYKDINCAFKIFPTQILHNIDLHSQHGFIDAEVMSHVKRGGYKVVELPVRHKPRVAGSGSGLGGSMFMIKNTAKEIVRFLLFGTP